MQPFLCPLILFYLIAGPSEGKVELSVEFAEDTSSDYETESSIYIPPDSVHPDDISFSNGDVVIEGALEGDIVVSEGPFALSGSTEGDVVLLGGEFAISGTVEGDLVAVGGEGRVSGTIDGDVVLIGGTLKLDSTAVIEGNLTAISGELEKDPQAVVKGEETEVSLGPLGKLLVRVLSRRAPPGKMGIEKPARTFASGVRIVASSARLIWIAVLYLLGLLMLVALPRWQRRSQIAVERAIWKTVLTGVVYRLAVGGIFVILIVSIIGWLLLPVAMLGYAFVALMGIPQASLWIGRLVKKWLRLSTKSRIGLYSIGFVAIYLISIISCILAIFGQGIGLAVRITYVIGFLILFAVMTIGRGGIIYTLIFPREVRALEKQPNQKTNEKG
jgi:cytoskeletal protein CcmA (bactofilin family)